MSSESVKPTLPTLQERYEACMLLHAVGDAMGYKNGKWEFTFSGRDIHDQLAILGGVENLNLDPSLSLQRFYTLTHTKNNSNFFNI